MAEPLPQALKIPEVSRFVNRANQLRTIKPAVAYWCEYHAVNQIVGKGLHTTGGDEAFAYTKTLIDRLEATKVEHASDESIVDNDVAKAYIEQFAQQTFDRAERTMRADKVTRQTADTFDAAATFFDILGEWGELEAEIKQKIKFSKWNAARILKAIREGKDPNETNPKPAEEDEEDPNAGEGQLDPNDPDVQQITSGSAPPAASVQDVPDAGEPAPGDGPPPPQVQEDYFPQVPDTHAGTSHPVAEPASSPPSVPSFPPEGPTSSASQIPPQPSPQIPTKIPSQFTPPSETPPTEPSAPSAWTGPPPTTSHPQAPSVPPNQPTPSSYIPAPVPAPVPAAVGAPTHNPPPPATPALRDFKDINKAQKHAKFAISALNFEDVPTAVQELRNALAALGTQ